MQHSLVRSNVLVAYEFNFQLQHLNMALNSLMKSLIKKNIYKSVAQIQFGIFLNLQKQWTKLKVKCYNRNLLYEFQVWLYVKNILFFIQTTFFPFSSFVLFIQSSPCCAQALQQRFLYNEQAPAASLGSAGSKLIFDNWSWWYWVHKTSLLQELAELSGCFWKLIKVLQKSKSVLRCWTKSLKCKVSFFGQCQNAANAACCAHLSYWGL